MKTPAKRKPDFKDISDKRLQEYIGLIQQMIFSYEYSDSEKVRVLTEVWKELSDESTDRLCKAPFVEPEKESPVVTHKIKMVKRIKR